MGFLLKSGVGNGYLVGDFEHHLQVFRKDPCMEYLPTLGYFYLL